MVENKNKFCNLKIISYYTGYVILWTAALMLLPIITSIAFKEWNTVLDFIISIDISAGIGMIFILFGKDTVGKVKVEWKHGLIIASLSWFLLMFLSAIPYKLSGHVGSYLDAIFDVMSGFTTTGLVLTQDLEHLALGMNMWRHIITFVGGQGMVVLALCFLVRDTAGAYKMYVGEGKDIELVPNVKGTARIIWKISMIYLVVGTLILWINGMFIGLKPVSAFFHGLFIFMSAWSTGGFAPMSQNMLYYHSFSYEIVTMIFFIVGSFNFGLHYAIWQGNRKEIYKNIETQSFFITATLASFFVALGLSKLNVYPNAMAIFRKGVYNLLSAHTTTGFANVYSRQFALEWGDFAIIIMTIAMLIGGSACSTAGGFKGLRVGLVFKGLIADIKKLLMSERKVSVFKFHYMKDNILEDGMVKSAALIIICYIILFSIGTAMGVYYGYPVSNAAFEAASATGNVGLSIGITSPSVPAALKIYYIIAMYLGRLEFMSVFALIGFIAGGIKKLCRRYSR
ncbi:MAG TPA: cation transporter [Clostridiaceae bacterium]|jgi:trk system potassium uptake protein TrkH|nr:cation transporter [Clostridiaceae bacterium]HBF76690.1 cation transporter [Clostridiaceae bacterium]HBG39744.1 cation transporter [Clostridiaceae bacterium]HBN28641.1 cation transporter [Clostridiaceae bacterium]HBX48317.1 cation transporter [Clostridiaceae bacterium]